jgi:thiopeptide-type bacteriocin biosynthesis protein
MHAAGPFFHLRTPLLPLDVLLALSADLDGPSAPAENLPAASQRDRAVVRERLRALLDLPEVREALYLASPTLAAAVDSWRHDPGGETGRRAEPAFVRYVTRMCSRPTPFGLFAGVSTGELAEETSLDLGPPATYRRRSRLDMELVGRIAAELESSSTLRGRLEWRPNSSLYSAGGRLRFAESQIDGDARTYRLVAVDQTPYLEATLARAAGGATLESLAEALAGEEISPEEARDFVEEVAAAQLLISDLSPQVTGSDPLETLTTRLRGGDGMAAAAESLARIRGCLASLDRGGLAADPSEYERIGMEVETFDVRATPGRSVQVDLEKPAEGLTLGRAVVAELERAVELLGRLPGPPADPSLASFTERFTERYGNRTVPLAEALDDEIGIGFQGIDAIAADPSPLLADLPLPAPPSPAVTWAAEHTIMAGLLGRALTAGADEIELTGGDLDALSSSSGAQDPLPDACAVSAVLAAVSPGEADAGRFEVLVQAVHGPSGARMLGRFCRGDRELLAHVERHLRDEEALRSGAVFAEIVHLPEGRLGNVLARPVLRAFEIPFLGRSGAPPDRQLPLTDLNVAVDGARVVLLSERLGREVLPRLTSAHNYTHRSLGVYRFLCSLQTQGVSGSKAWSWGPLETMPFLPRLRSGRIVLSRARWVLGSPELDRLTAKGADGFRELRDLRTELRLPRFVALADADAELRTDLDNPLSVDALLDLLRGRNRARLIEAWPEPERMCVTGPEGRFAHEILVPLVRTSPASVRAAAGTSVRPPSRRPTASFERSFPPGSEWLYAKLYTGTSTADLVLAEAVRPLVDVAGRAGIVRWFFLRYADPEWHLRLRLHGDPRVLASDLVPQLRELTAPLMERGLLWRVQLDTYEREVERYGGEEGMLAVERLFHADSEAALDLVEQLPGDHGLDARFRLALAGVDSIFEDFGIPLERRRHIARGLAQSLANELGEAEERLRAAGRLFRRERADVERLLSPGASEAHPLGPGLAVLGAASSVAAEAVSELRRLDADGILSTEIEDIAVSLAHLRVNRLLRSAHRSHEMVLYSFLDRLYLARESRAR